MFRVLAVIALAASTLSACVVVPVPVHRGRHYSESPPPVYVAPYPHRRYYRGY